MNSMEERVPPIDMDGLRTNCAGDESLMREMLELFTQEGPKLMADVRLAHQGRDATQLRKTAHRLKGALVSLSATPSVALAAALEKAAAGGQLDEADRLVAALEEEVARLDRSMPSLVASC